MAEAKRTTPNSGKCYVCGNTDQEAAFFPSEFEAKTNGSAQNAYLD